MQSRWFIGILLGWILLDRITKVVFETFPTTQILGKVLQIQGSYNTGVAFSLPVPRLLLAIITITCLIAVFWYYRRYEHSKKSNILSSAYALILAGGISHAYDRIMLGRVFDFIALKYFAIFNVADIMISVGAIIILYHSLRHEWNRSN